MKKIYLIFALVLVVGLFLFGCSDDGNVVEKVNVKETNLSETRSLPENTMTSEEEDAAFQELFVQLDSLNAEYAAMNGPQTRVVGGTITPWLRATFNVVAADATGALLGHSIGGWFGATVTGIAASIKAVNSLDKDGRIDANIIKWTTRVVKSFFSSVGPTLSDFDKAGDVHNCTIDKLYANYGKDKVSNMSDANLVDLIINRLVYVEGYRLPANFNYNNLYSAIPSIDGVIQTNDYKLYLQRMAVQKPIIKNECVTLDSFLTGFQSVNEDNSMKYVIDFRNKITNSGISATAKNNICVTLSIGFASANFWEEQK